MNISDLKERSYIPYSNQPKIAVIKSKNGTFFPGVRVENISFPLTISAIQSALYGCLSEGEKPETLYIDEEKPAERPMLAYWKQQYDIDIQDLNQLTDISFSPVLRSVEDIPSTLQNLLNQALVNQSDFPVSALLETKDGFISGVNIENADWSEGLCAERIALAKALTYGYTNFKALHICTRDGEYSSPCGACRQVIIEHLPHHPVHLYHADGTKAQHFSSDLLPYSFQSSSLKKKS